MELDNCSTDNNSAFNKRGQTCAEFVYCQFIDDIGSYYQCGTCSEQLIRQNTQKSQVGKESAKYNCNQTFGVTYTYNGATGTFGYATFLDGKCKYEGKMKVKVDV